MGKIDFKRIIVIGYGYITGEVIKYINEQFAKDVDTIEYIEHEVHEFNTAKSYCLDKQIENRTIENKNELTDYLSRINSKTLIISASNNYLIPISILDSEYVTAMNFHNALLPKFPGRNAPSWAIFEGEKETGITWHYVTGRVDAGNIIIQKKTSIDDDIKAYELASVLMNIAFEGFKECIEDVLCEQVGAQVQTVAAGRKMYLSKDVPGDAKFDISDSWEYIYRLLRATDYAKYDIFPNVTTVVDGKTVRVVRYKIVEKQAAKKDAGFLLIPIDESKVLQIKYKPL